MLMEIKTYLRQHRRASLADLAHRFGVEPDSLRGMMAIWVGKGQVRKIRALGTCGGCAACAVHRLEIYEWTG